MPKGPTVDWLPFCGLEVTSGSLWAGDPLIANAEDGCVLDVPRGMYCVEAVGLAHSRNRVVCRLRVRLETAANPTLGEEVGHTGTDSAMIGVCDIKEFDALFVEMDDNDVQDAIELQTKNGFGIVGLKPTSDGLMPFVPIGSDGTGPVFALMDSGDCVGMQLAFMEENDMEGDVGDHSGRVSLLGSDKDDFKTWALPEGEEMSCWIGGKIEPDVDIHIWASPSVRLSQAVAFRIREKNGGVLSDWKAMDDRDNGKKFNAVVRLLVGGYEIDFQIGDDVFSALHLILK